MFYKQVIPQFTFVILLILRMKLASALSTAVTELCDSEILPVVCKAQ